ncbi:DedA family protein [Actinokineospora pegani]|uniref:DedA family protein n=1 Tax=Actinokineospora pegani TaxID=2654637 RepID=UPI0012EA3503|nr:DedA family protein [Actinokineospora pegani]
MDFVFDWLEHAGPLVVWTVVLGFVFTECAFIIGLFLPGDALLFAAGVVLAQNEHEHQAWWLSLVATVVAVAGNQTGYHIGSRAGHTIIARRGGKVLNAARLEQAKRYLDQRGFFALVVARWLPWVRTLAPLIAGAARMDARRFALATFVGAVAWVPVLVLAGYYAAGLLDGLPWLQTAAVVGSIVFFVVGTSWGVWRYRQEMRRPAQELSLTDPA